MTKKLFITGGHATTALAVIDEIKEKHPDWELIFVGRKFAMEGDKEVSEEFRLVKEYAIKFLSLTTGRSRPFNFPKILIGFLQSLVYLIKYRPDAILSFGGYIALPVVISGWLLGIPSVTHEQTMELGLANKIISIFAKKVCVSWEIGIPIRKQLFSPPKEPSFAVDKKLPLIYITGGSTGAQSLNEKIYPVISELVKKFIVVHQTGRRFNQKSSLRNYIIAPYFSVSDLAWIYKHATIVLSRGGANTVGENAALGKVAIFVPLPWSANNEQEKNAQLLVEAGSSELIPQSSLTAKSLLGTIKKIEVHYDRYLQNAKYYAKTVPKDAANRVVDELSTIIS